MGKFAKVRGGIVVQVIEAEQDWIDKLSDNASYIQTSFNTRGGVHYGADGKPDGGVALRGNYATVGGSYDEVNDVFYSAKPFSSWVLNKNSWTWEAPVAMPKDGKVYNWDEPTKAWVEVVV